MNKTQNNAPLVAQLVEERVRLHEAAEELLIRLARGETITADERLIFSAIGWSDSRGPNGEQPEIPKQVSRMERVLLLQVKAQTPAAYEAAKRTRDETIERVAAERAEIQEQLAALNARLGAIDKEGLEAERAVTTIEAARDNLQQRLPQHVQSRITDAQRQVGKQFGPTIAQLETRVNLCKSVPQITDEDSIVLHCRSLPADHPARPYESERRQVVDRDAWKAYCDELRAELSEVETALAVQNDKRRAAMSEANSGLDYYWDRELASPSATMTAASAANATVGDEVAPAQIDGPASLPRRKSNRRPMVGVDIAAAINRRRMKMLTLRLAFAGPRH